MVSRIVVSRIVVSRIVNSGQCVRYSLAVSSQYVRTHPEDAEYE